MSEERRFGITTNKDADFWVYVGKQNIFFEMGLGDVWTEISVPLEQAKNILEAVLERIEEQENDR